MPPAGWGMRWPWCLAMGTLPRTCPVPMPLAQLNLKIPEAVRTHWQREAAAAGLSVRDWLIRQTMPGEAPPIPSDPGLLDRVVTLECQVAELLGKRTRPPGDPVRQAMPAAPVSTSEGLEGSAVARSLGITRNGWNARVAREGGAKEGLVVSGWRCIGLRQPARGGPLRAVWVPDADT